MSRLPLSVIGGYLGAGKTPLINQLLASDHGLQLAVLVNDFGAINIDKALLNSASKDTIELTNGCVCCMMSGDLFFAIGDLLDRTPPPDHIIVEASGISDPAKIAAVALAEPDLRYAGIVTVVDALNIEDQLDDPQIGTQVRGQIDAADLIAIGKAELPKNTGLELRVSCPADDLKAITALLFEPNNLHAPNPGAAEHPGYVQWSDATPRPLGRDQIQHRLASIPDGVLRLKALLNDPTGGGLEVHIVGSQSEVRSSANPQTGIVAIALSSSLSAVDIARWWQSDA